ncbi:MAG: TldD/PmbA family protein [Planctomycetes bacterium]|nr:TldD/PmbA family protein [Planctomycetota bacterium]
MKDLALHALDAARAAGATYADARLARYRRRDIRTQDKRVNSLTDSEDIGLGVRVVADGSWGFAGSADLTNEGVEACAREAVAVARASALTRPGGKITLAPEKAQVSSFVSPREIDPFKIPVERKADLLLRVAERMLSVAKIRKTYGAMSFRGVHKVLASTEGTLAESDVITSQVGYGATAVGKNDAKSRNYEPPPQTRGYEIVREEDLLANAQRVAEQAVEHLQAKPCPVGKRDLILDPLHLALTIHESVGHATELDRVLGMEESLAGRSFATPEKIGNFRYGSPVVNLVADNTLEGGLATGGFDDDGVAGQRWDIVEEGILRGYSTSREVAPVIGQDRSTGGNRADHWSSIPIVRIPNLSLMPGRRRLTLQELIADTKEGIYIEGMGSFSIDQMRLNFQFGGDAFWEIKDGRITGMLKDVTYQSITPRFWASCDAVCDERAWVPNGVLNCGKGDPMQISQMTHGAAPARFRQVDVGGASETMKSYRAGGI